jgi:hypothetical protein
MKLKEILLEDMIKLKSLLLEEWEHKPIKKIGGRLKAKKGQRKYNLDFIKSAEFLNQIDSVQEIQIVTFGKVSGKEVIDKIFKDPILDRLNLKVDDYNVIIPLNEIKGKGKNEKTTWTFLIMYINDTYRNLVNDGDIKVKWENEFASFEDWKKAVNIYEKARDGKEAREGEKAANKKYWEDWFIDLKPEPYELGDQSSQIEKIYKLLGIRPPQGVFTKGLVVALEAWQKENRLTVTGEWDQDTRNKFYEKYKYGDWYPGEFDPEDDHHVVVPVASSNANDDDDITIDKGVPAIPFRNKAEGNAFRKWVNDNYQQWAQDNDLSRTGDWKKGQRDFKDYMLKAWNNFGKEYIDGNNYKKIKQKNVVNQKDNSITF